MADRLSFALYNGDMDESPKAADRRRGAEIRGRRLMRDEAPPILLTNVAMLEDMLMRGEDRRLLKESQGSLRWIVLDEAHSCVGTKAAEMARCCAGSDRRSARRPSRSGSLPRSATPAPTRS